MPRVLHVVDAFTDRPFHGNPAAVCVLESPASTIWMQHVAREMNLAETAFVVPRHDGFDLRWFTPTTEVSLCGHATLASAFVLWHTHQLAPGVEAKFHTRSGVLICKKDGASIAMDFPATPIGDSFETDGATCRAIEQCLGCSAKFISSNGTDYLIELQSHEQLRGVQPDFLSLKAIDARGFIVTSRNAGVDGFQDVDFFSRFFAPRVGVAEDPVTGSAHCTLGPYWGKRLGKTELRGYQASERGGYVDIRWMGDRVLLLGQAVLMSRIELYSNPISCPF